MAKADSQAAGKGKVFFERAEQVAETGNWDFAIEMCLQGILREPGNIERGHHPLRNVSLVRKAQGGKGPGMMEQFKHKGGKTPEEVLINAEYLLAKEPGSVPYMVQVLAAAQELKLSEVAKWMCDILLRSQQEATKGNLKILKLLTQTYADIEEYKLAVQTCEMAIVLAPKDTELQDTLNDLSAKYTIHKGKYDQEGGFLKGVKDVEKQRELSQKDSMTQSRDYLQRQVDSALKEYEQAPTVPGKINAAVNALLKLEDESFENQAIDILNKAYSDTKTYQFKMRIGDLRIKQMMRRYKKLLARDKTAAIAQAKEQLAFELIEFTERAANYPTDLTIKFELGRRQYASGKLDDAIASFQQAQREPRRHLQAMSYLARSFAGKGWFPEAAETYEKALQAEMSDQAAKELRYDFGDVLEKMGDLEQALEQFSDVAQIEFTFKDVRDRVEGIRKKLSEAKDKPEDDA